MHANRFLALFCVTLLVGCATTQAPVGESAVVKRPTDKQAEKPVEKPKGGQTHVVEKGDTLYSIAFRYGIDFRTLAAVNGIRDPFTIYPGQVLTIKSRGLPVVPKPKPAPKPESTTAATAATPASATTSAPVATKPVPVSSPYITSEPGAAGSNAAVKPAEATKPAETQTLASATPAASTGEAKPATVRNVGGGSWQWPAQGTVLGGFNRGGVGPKGIAIAGKAGDPVRAARDGRVVYIGDSLVGYGQLVIVKHDDVYLSAYAHNSRLLVKEGEAVKAGDTIAEMGSTGADRTKLHFEVRRNGDPIDPLSVLPPQ